MYLLFHFSFNEVTVEYTLSSLLNMLFRLTYNVKNKRQSTDNICFQYWNI